MAIPDPAASSAVLIGCDTYQHLESLPSVANNLSSLRSMLCDPDVLGLAEDRCRVLANPTSTDDVLDAVHDAAQASTDMLIVYFAGHGLLDSRTNDLYLAMPGSSEDRLHRALRYDDVRRVVMDASRVLAKVVILDCCYSGAALLGGMGGTATMADQAGIEGTYLLTASAETKLALAPVGETYTAFTGEILAALDTGLPDGPDTIDLDALYFHIRHELEAKGRPVPQQRARNGGRSIVLARNRRGSRTSGTAATKRELPTVPPGYDDLVTATPRVIVDRIALLSPSLRATVLAAAGARHDDQVVAALVDLLQRTGSTDASHVFTGVARRTPAEIVAVADALATIGLRQSVSDLLVTLAAQPAHDLAALAAVLHGRGSDALLSALLDAAAERTATPESLITLVGALSPVNVREHVDRMLAKKAAETPAAAAIVIADALREAGRDEAAYRFYGAAVTEVAGRPPAEIAALISAMRTSGLPTPHDEIADATITIAARRAGLCAAITAFRSGGLDVYERQALTYAATHLVPQDVAKLADQLREARQPELSLQLCIEAATARGAEMTLAITESLQDAGRPIDAFRVLDEVAAVWPRELLTELVHVFHEANEIARLLRFLKAVAVAQPERLAQLTAPLVTGAEDERKYWGTILRRLARQDPEHSVPIALALRDQHARVAADLLFAEIVVYGSEINSEDVFSVIGSHQVHGDIAFSIIRHATRPVSALRAITPGLLKSPTWSAELMNRSINESAALLPIIITLRDAGLLEPWIVAISGQPNVRNVSAVVPALRDAECHDEAKRLLNGFVRSSEQLGIVNLISRLDSAGCNDEADYVRGRAPGAAELAPRPAADGGQRTKRPWRRGS